MSEFKVGDRVYCPMCSNRITVILGTAFDDYPLGIGDYTFTHCGREYETHVSPQLFRATHENYELLSKLYPNIAFEKPKLTGSDLTRQKLAEGAREVLCWVSDDNDDDAITEKCIATVVDFHDTHHTFVTGMRCHWNWKYAVPVPRNYYAMDDN